MAIPANSQVRAILLILQTSTPPDRSQPTRPRTGRPAGTSAAQESAGTVHPMSEPANLPARTGTPLPMIPTGADAAAARTAAATARTEIARRVAQVEQATARARADLEEQRRSLEAEFARRRAELEAQVAPLRDQLAKMTEVAWSIDLYLGRDEDLTLIRDGAPAPPETPLTIRQRVLAMSEESLLLFDRTSAGMDYRDINTWVDWLTADPAHLDRILPEPKGVVVLVPTRAKSDTGNVFEDAAHNAANESAWWLLRNGQRVHLLTTDPRLRLTQRVLPRRTEFTDVFEQRIFGHSRPGGRLEPGSSEWLELEKKADARRRHYMRVMLVLQGLLDRTAVFHPLPAGGVNLLDVRAQTDGKVVLLADDETSLLLTDGRESFRQWQARLGAQMRRGLRVIGAFDGRDFGDLERDYDNRYTGRHPRLSPATASHPPTGIPLLIEDQRDGGYVVRYPRTDTVYRSNVPVPDRPGYVYRTPQPVAPARRAACVLHTDDTFILPFDLATVEDLRYYLNSRDNREKHFLTMVPVLRAALAAKEAEAQAEAPFRQLLADRLVHDGADPGTVHATLDELVHWWKTANTYARPLNGEPKDEAKALTDIVTRHRELQAADPDADANVVRAARAALPDAIGIGRTRTGRWRAYVPSTPVPKRDHRVHLDVVDLHRDGTPASTRPWQVLTARSVSAMQMVHTEPAWDTWPFGANRRHHITGPERDQLVTELLTTVPGIPIAVTEHFDPHHPERGRVLAAYSWTDGTPETTPVRAVSDPFSWHYDGGPLTVTARQVHKDSDGVRLGSHPEHGRGYASFWSQYSTSGATGLPWWPDDAHQYGDSRPWLLWQDTDVRARLETYARACAAESAAERSEKAAAERETYRYVPGVTAAIRAELEQAARTRFDEDYPDAPDLWPAHLAALKLADPLHERDIWGLVHHARTTGHPVVGATLSQLYEHAGTTRVHAHYQHGPVGQTLQRWGHVVVPDPAGDDTGN